ncbi:hypothetical protein ABK040_010785 [Willaertia magna]
MKLFIAVCLMVALSIGFALAESQGPVPGFQYMLSGFNIRTMSTTVQSAKDSIAEQSTSMIFLPTFEMETSFRMPNTQDHYDVPDAFMAYPLTSTQISKTSDLFFKRDESMKYSINQFSFSVKANVGAYGAEAKLSSAWGRIREVFKSDTCFSATGYIKSTLYQTSLYPPMFLTLHPFFKRMLARIKSTPQSAQDLEPVKDLIKYYGVVFATKAIFGGRMDSITAVSNSILDSYDKKWATTQLSLQFTYNTYSFDTGGFKNKTDIKIAKEFADKSNAAIYFIGGDQQQQTNDTIREWFQTIKGNPEIIGGSFQLLSEVIGDDPVKKKNLEIILTQYANTARGVESVTQELQPIPGYQLIGSGFDLLTAQPKLNLFINTDFSQGKTWTNPIYKDLTFAAPNDLKVVNNAESYYSNSTFVAVTKSEYEYEYQKHTSKKKYFGLAKKSKDVYVYKYRYDNKEQYQLNTFRRISWYDLVLKPQYLFDIDNNLDPFAKRYIRSLPSVDTPENRQIYKKFIEYYGTSVVTKVTMGGGIFFKVFFKKSLSVSLNIEEIHKQSGWTFLHIFGAKSKRDYYFKQLSQEFLQNTQIQFNTQGGIWKPELALIQPRPDGAKLNILDSPQGYVEWDSFADTIKYEPYPVDYELIPISEIFTDANKKAIMRSVLEEHIRTEVANADNEKVRFPL